jgi:hypothetical protein
VLLGLFALQARAPFVWKVGPAEGGGDEWYSAWRSWAVLTEGARPGNYLHPALSYDLGAGLFAAIAAIGRLTGRYHDLTDTLAHFVRDEVWFLKALEGLSVVLGSLTVVVVFLLGRQLFGLLAGVIAAGCLAVVPLHIQYSERARVDALFVLCVAASGLGFLAVERRGRRRDSVLSGLLLGLAVAANYPGLLLLFPYVWVHLRRGATRTAAIGLLVALLTFVVTNPAVVLNPADVWAGFRFQGAMAWTTHPFREGLSPGFYRDVFLDQGRLACAAAAAALLWFAVQGEGLPRVLAVTSLFYLVLFGLLSTQFDRYVLAPFPWIAVLIGGLAGSIRARWGRAAGTAATLAACAMVFESARAALPYVVPVREDVRADPQRRLHAWLIDHARPPATIWIEADTWPLLQATFADQGGPLQARMQDAFKRAYPEFRPTVLKAERVETQANFDPALITGGQVRFALTCARYLDYAREPGRDLGQAAAFYDALAKSCRRVQESPDGCWIDECPGK